MERERDPSHAANLTPETWRSLVKAADFTVTDLETRTGAIGIALTPWLQTSGTTGKQAERVRWLFDHAPESARRHFQITTDADGETHFAWQRVILRAVAGEV